MDVYTSELISSDIFTEIVIKDYEPDDFDNYYYPDDNLEIAEGSRTSAETFNSSANTKSSIQVTLDILTIPLESKKKGNKLIID
ncbi:7318_t:CDS:2 [Dentiscutata erythropus]|uniref:7318_t:CDS:1 n=1 Tax=Dentiscutata erythropus TaxID=1348616 RepID=A0A9N8YQV5_9GLOM|nr:7318_t:CDS:2 [Dentiscutata erythropus]